jgi:hypothetical protein
MTVGPSKQLAGHDGEDGEKIIAGIGQNRTVFENSIL